LPISKSKIADNLQRIRERMDAAARRAGRSPESVRLLAVTKSVGMDETQALVDLGVTDLGENRVETARSKIEAIGRAVNWHMIGSVQRRKARDVAPLFDWVHSVDRLDLAEELDKRAVDRNTPLEVLLEVNVSGEESKHGVTPAELPALLEAVRPLSRLRVRGLMTMAPFVDDPEAVRPVFAGLRRLAEAHGLAELSMGMSNDYEVAIEEGATIVRIGTALFK
jgi:pyridoxal phosphate enzyme (YggS family)